MLDVRRIVQDTELIRKGLLKRMEPDEFDLDEIINLYKRKQTKLSEFEKLRTEQKSFNDAMAKTDKKSDEFKVLVTKLKDISSKVKQFSSGIIDGTNCPGLSYGGWSNMTAPARNRAEIFGQACKSIDSIQLDSDGVDGLYLADRCAIEALRWNRPHSRVCPIPYFTPH